jgi:hypothetical protein
MSSVYASILLSGQSWWMDSSHSRSPPHQHAGVPVFLPAWSQKTILSRYAHEYPWRGFFKTFNKNRYPHDSRLKEWQEQHEPSSSMVSTRHSYNTSNASFIQGMDPYSEDNELECTPLTVPCTLYIMEKLLASYMLLPIGGGGGEGGGGLCMTLL